MSDSGPVKELIAEKDHVERHLAEIDPALFAFPGEYAVPENGVRRTLPLERIGD
jgi:hypothetical protein